MPDPLGRRFEFEVRSLEDIRHRGQVFTPPDVVQLMVALAQLPAAGPCQILDPACGSGRILLGTAHTLLGEPREEGTAPEASSSSSKSEAADTPSQESDPSDSLLGGLDAVATSASRAVVGLELDPRLATLARANLCSWAGSTAIHQVDALSMAERLEARFDRVIANPPYVAWRDLEPSVRADLAAGFLGCGLKGRPNHRDGQPNLALYFILLGFHALKPGGRMVYLVPPEWLTTPRAAPLRRRLGREGLVRQLILFGARVRLFEALGRSGGTIGTGSMLLVVDKPLEASVSGGQLSFWQPRGVAVDRSQSDRGQEKVRWVHVAALDGSRRGVLSQIASIALAAGEAASLGGEAAIGGEGTPDVASSDLEEAEAQIQVQDVAWQTLSESGWHRRSIRTGGYGSDVSAVASGIKLGEIPGITVVGGHQPRVAWLAWLELDEVEKAQLPVSEQSFLVPVAPSARDLTFPRLGPPRRWWVMFGREMGSEAELAERSPNLYEMMHRKLEDAMMKEKKPPKGWWQFPNPRNVSLFGSSQPRLMAPRTASELTLCWDAFGHHIKGTNSAVFVAAEAPVSIEALFALLNSVPVRRQAGAAGRSYHGVGILQEPRALRGIFLPGPLSSFRQELSELGVLGRAAVHDSAAWVGVNRLAEVICR